ncbi:hypothetical protein D3C78_1527480 [compost metagenome]
MGDHGLHRARLGAHLGQINRDRLRAAGRLHADVELHIALKGLDRGVFRARVDRPGDIFGRIPRHGRAGLGLGGGFAFHHADAVELGVLQIGRQFRHARVEPLGQQGRFGRADALLARTIGDRFQQGQALIQRKQLAIVARRLGLQVQRRRRFVEETSAAQRGAQQI